MKIKTIAISVTLMFIAVINPLTVSAKEISDTYLSEEITELCQSLGDEYEIPCEILESLIEAESAGKMSARNGPCYGICQINEDVWGTDFDTEEKQIEKACQLLAGFMEKEPDITYALARYNGQSDALKKYRNGELSANKYIKKVMSRADDLQKLHADQK